MTRIQMGLSLLALVFLPACQQILGPGNDTELATSSQASCGFLQNPYGQRVSWKTQSPVLFYLDPSVTPEFESTLTNTAAVWEKIVGRKLMTFQRTNAASTPAKDGRNVIYMLSDWPSQAASYQAFTDVYWKYNRIEEADIKVNEKYFHYYNDAAGSIGGIHFGSLMLHELGHAMGLRHMDPKPTVMWPILGIEEIRMNPSSKDQEAIKCEY